MFYQNNKFENIKFILIYKTLIFPTKLSSLMEIIMMRTLTRRVQAFIAAALLLSTLAPAMADEIAVQTNGTVTYQEVRRVFDLLDNFDVEGFGKLIAEGGEVRFGNGPSMIGVDAISEGQRGFFAAIKKMEHSLSPDGIWSKDGSFVVEGTVTYTRMDDSTLTIPFADVFYLNNGKISKLYVYFDVAPLFAEAQQ